MFSKQYLDKCRQQIKAPPNVSLPNEQYLKQHDIKLLLKSRINIFGQNNFNIFQKNIFTMIPRKDTQSIIETLYFSNFFVENSRLNKKSGRKHLKKQASTLGQFRV